MAEPAKKIVSIADPEPSGLLPLVADVPTSAARLRARGFTTASKWTIFNLIKEKRLTPIRCGKKIFISIAELDAMATPKKK